MKINKVYIPSHLKKYIVDQDYNSYTSIDHACWKFILKISIDFFSKNAHSSYIDGLKKTGVRIDKIPKIETINKKLQKFGWRAVCVRGFIPPNAFMEFQSLKVLPIASDMRSHKHLTYTPSPDIVHEAAGHAPIIANKDYSDYLSHYGEIANKAIMSNEDLELYYAIRDLSDLKENINSKKETIAESEKNLKKAYKKISYISESAYLSRMNWWTVEYGLIGKKNNPQIYGAGLLSSVAESENCLSDNIKKYSFDIKCINYKYDITEQQPQLFITPNFKKLTSELKKLSKTMSYKIGGVHGLTTSLKAKTLCTIEIDKYIEISGVLVDFSNNNQNIHFIKMDGPCQISINQKQLLNHGTKHHATGYSTPIGYLEKINKSINELNKEELIKYNITKKAKVNLKFKQNISVKGIIKNILKRNSKIIIITFKECTVTKNKKIIFNKLWGDYDLICGSKITSVYGGAADKNNYYNNITDDKKYLRYNTKDKKINKKLIDFFDTIDNLKKTKDINQLYLLYKTIKNKSVDDWLLKYQFLEITNCNRNIKWIDSIYLDLYKMSQNNNDLGRAIKRGLKLFK